MKNIAKKVLCTALILSQVFAFSVVVFANDADCPVDIAPTIITRPRPGNNG